MAHDAEAIGVDTLWVPDEIGFWDPWAILPAVAATTSHVNLGPLVLCTGYRHPATIAAMAAGLDEVSGGRSILGLGSGYGSRDPGWSRLGFEAADHVERFEESVEIVVRLLRRATWPGPQTFDGRIFRLQGGETVPPGPRPDGPPVWVAAGKRRTMEVAVRWADVVNLNSALTDAASVEASIGRVREACAVVGRAPESLGVTGWARVVLDRDAADRTDTIAGSPDEIAGALRALHEAGISHVSCYVGHPDDPSPYPALTRPALERWAAVMDHLGKGPDA
jgi:alkanesulfonate monooxygenase SsuD/methylene tetrahydromethanopterin reductase-like flavin-dependent oxidoreductase (luciferase family)